MAPGTSCTISSQQGAQAVGKADRYTNGLLTKVAFDKEAHIIPHFIAMILSKDQFALELVSALELASTMGPADGLCT